MPKLTYYGHSTFRLDAGGQVILIDPFISGNPSVPEGVNAETVEADVILLTHGHGDHLGDTVAIAKRTGCLVVAMHELAGWVADQGVERTHGMNLGGGYNFDFGRVTFTIAFHTNSVNDNGKMICMGVPNGLVIEADDKTFYHAGDTALFSDMQLIAKKWVLDVAALPIGDNYTMGPDDALMAAVWLKAATTVPIHYNTFPPIEVDVGAWANSVDTAGLGVNVMGKGEVLEY